MSPVIREMLDERTVVRSLTVEQYHRMIEMGILESGEPVELLDGVILHKDRSASGDNPMTVHPRHAWVVQRLIKLAGSFASRGCHIRIQQPMTLPPYNEPEPDGAVIRGTGDDFAHHHPGPTDVLCVIEVADASLRRDRTVKQRIYAESAIPEYVIVNLTDNTVEHYTQPVVEEGRYAETKTMAREGLLSLPTAGERLEIPVHRLLP